MKLLAVRWHGSFDSTDVKFRSCLDSPFHVACKRWMGFIGL